MHVFSDYNSVIQQFLHELRDISIQKDRMRFRNNIRRIGQVMAYEISKTLSYSSNITTTPMGVANTQVIKEQPVIASVLRAGLPLQTGLSDVFDQADLAFISAYRHHLSENEFEIKVEYLACPDLTDKVFILADPMLATGQSLVQTYHLFKKMGQPKSLHVVSVIGSRTGVEYLNKHLPNAHLWIGTMDDELNEAGYIVPGLGDAGDLYFGEKIQH